MLQGAMVFGRVKFGHVKFGGVQGWSRHIKVACLVAMSVDLVYLFSIQSVTLVVPINGLIAPKPGASFACQELPKVAPGRLETRLASVGLPSSLTQPFALAFAL